MKVNCERREKTAAPHKWSVKLSGVRGGKSGCGW